MNQQPDRLFREKLENFQKAAPAHAWSRVEAGLTKKNNRTLWLKVAASLLLLVAAALLLLLWPQKNTAPMLTQKNTGNAAVEKIKTPEKNEAAPAPSTAAPEKKATSETPVTTNKRSVKPHTKKEQAVSPSPEVATPELIAEVQEEITEIIPEEVTTAVTAPTAETSAAAADAGVTLVYTAEEVNKKYLDKKSLAEATPADKKPSTLRKLLDKAYDLKHNQDPFGDLRQKKNEILALNFKSEKQRSQNK
ncbi:hypothetical protein KK083_13795 [Fulvivirgaceae bacterium PWU4]|uniref:Uncharacterized protein n=1 Tax=Chryseosolibacter histidini TaxID=2782349 RepID=A0AAP2DKR2_9BACT|nr:hypothetical protein [Chryseosolibacter histidini]MBT1697961.1 hypothetical protein [Chryseosolibacter histidini]